MKKLENKIPPAVVCAVCALAMKALALVPACGTIPRYPVTAAVVVLIGIGFGIAGLGAFYQARTTINPLTPERTTQFVSGGIYRISRNPMYVGVACCLGAWAIWLAHWAAWLGVIAFIAYITRFQILPEERVLQQKFGTPYQQYCQRVRRWL